MSESPTVLAIRNRLHAAGYESLSTPFRVASVNFAFTGALRGHNGRSLDLVLLIDTTTGDFGDRDGVLVRQRVEALSRALDITGSRYVVTAILAGAALVDGIEALSETCRVLHVESIVLNDMGKPADDVEERKLDDRIRVLLPLTLPAPRVDVSEGSGSAIDQLARALPSDIDGALVNLLVEASRIGEHAVTDVIAATINNAFQQDVGEAPQ